MPSFRSEMTRGVILRDLRFIIRALRKIGRHYLLLDLLRPPRFSGCNLISSLEGLMPSFRSEMPREVILRDLGTPRQKHPKRSKLVHWEKNPIRNLGIGPSFAEMALVKSWPLVSRKKSTLKFSAKMKVFRSKNV